jgi:hypothetical protein
MKVRRNLTSLVIVAAAAAAISATAATQLVHQDMIRPAAGDTVVVPTEGTNVHQDM